jgi:hypothetical protein
MPLESYPDQLEPENQDAVIWRFMKLAKFRDLMATGELYFCRADLFPNDVREGLPPEDYLHVLGLHPFDVLDRQQLCHHLGSDAQFREGFYVSCWHLFRDETCNMWKDYGEDGVAICSRYRLLKTNLNAIEDRAYLGLVRYGSKHLTGWNVLRLSPPNGRNMRTSVKSGHFYGLVIHSRASTAISTARTEYTRSR